MAEQRRFPHLRELNVTLMHHTQYALQFEQYVKGHKKPDNKKIRVTVISECIHKLMYWLSQRPDSPYLGKTMLLQKQLTN